MDKIIHSRRALLFVAWVAALGLVFTHGSYFYYRFMPIDTWLEYHSVRPVKEEVCINDTIKFVSDTTLNTDLVMRFNDILYCKDPNTDTYERYNSQNTERLHSIRSKRVLTVWPFNPGVSYETTCFLESNIRIEFPMNVIRTIRYSGFETGATFNVVKCN
jgi:hypothetical protein